VLAQQPLCPLGEGDLPTHALEERRLGECLQDVELRGQLTADKRGDAGDLVQRLAFHGPALLAKGDYAEHRREDDERKERRNQQQSQGASIRHRWDLSVPLARLKLRKRDARWRKEVRRPQV